MTATTFACSTVASSSANSAAHRYDPGARPSSSNWTDYVVSLYDPTVDNENEEPCPEICLILGDAAAGPERGPKDATTQRFTDVSATVPRKECDTVPRKDCDSTGAVDGILKVGAEVLGVPRPVPKRPPSPESSCGSDDPDPTGTISVEREEGEADGSAEEGGAQLAPRSPPGLAVVVPPLAVVVPPPRAGGADAQRGAEAQRGADPQSFSLFGAFPSEAGGSCGGPELLRTGDDELLEDNLRRLELSPPLGSPDAHEPEPPPWVQGGGVAGGSLHGVHGVQGGSEPSLASEARGGPSTPGQPSAQPSTPGHRRSNSDPPSTPSSLSAANFNIWGACSGSRVWAHEVSQAGP